MKLFLFLNSRSRRACAKTAGSVPAKLAGPACHFSNRIDDGDIISIITSACGALQEYTNWLHQKCHSKIIRRSIRLTNQCERFKSLSDKTLLGAV